MCAITWPPLFTNFCRASNVDLLICLTGGKMKIEYSSSRILIFAILDLRFGQHVFIDIIEIVMQPQRRVGQIIEIKFKHVANVGAFCGTQLAQMLLNR